MKKVHSTALFRLTVLGPLACREKFKRGEVTKIIREISEKPMDIPGSRNTFLSKKTIENWYYRWKHGGIDALAPKSRCDHGESKLSPELQQKIITLKKDNNNRSVRMIKDILENRGDAKKGELSRSSIHRLLQQQNLSRPPKEETTIERRSYEAHRAGDIWVGDVMHGPCLSIDGKERKVYLVSLMDDASRLLPHSAFCLGETALDIEGVLKQAILKRGLCLKLVVDNGPAYRAESFQAICARLGIRLIFCRPYDPESKGKLERFHRLFRSQFLSELKYENITQLDDLNTRLWAWIHQVYHNRTHGALDNMSPLERYQKDLVHVQPLQMPTEQYDKIFHYHVQRKVRTDGTISYEGKLYEVPYTCSDQTVMLIVDPHKKRPLYVESLKGDHIGLVTELDSHANVSRRRHRPNIKKNIDHQITSPHYSTVEETLKKQVASLHSSIKKS